VGQAVVDLRFWREGKVTRYDVLSVTGELTVNLKTVWEPADGPSVKAPSDPNKAHRPLAPEKRLL